MTHHLITPPPRLFCAHFHSRPISPLPPSNTRPMSWLLVSVRLSAPASRPSRAQAIDLGLLRACSSRSTVFARTGIGTDRQQQPSDVRSSGRRSFRMSSTRVTLSSCRRVPLANSSRVTATPLFLTDGSLTLKTVTTRIQITTARITKTAARQPQHLRYVRCQSLKWPERASSSWLWRKQWGGGASGRTWFSGFEKKKDVRGHNLQSMTTCPPTVSQSLIVHLAKRHLCLDVKFRFCPWSPTFWFLPRSSSGHSAPPSFGVIFFISLCLPTLDWLEDRDNFFADDSVHRFKLKLWFYLSFVLLVCTIYPFQSGPKYYEIANLIFTQVSTCFTTATFRNWIWLMSCPVLVKTLLLFGEKQRFLPASLKSASPRMFLGKRCSGSLAFGLTYHGGISSKLETPMCSYLCVNRIVYVLVVLGVFSGIACRAGLLLARSSSREYQFSSIDMTVLLNQIWSSSTGCCTLFGVSIFLKPILFSFVGTVCKVVFSLHVFSFFTFLAVTMSVRVYQPAVTAFIFFAL